MKTPTPEQWVTIKSLFDGALHAKPSEREAYLVGSSCEPVVIAEVKRMLAEDAAGDLASVLGPDGLASMAARLVADEEMFTAGDKVGQFEVLGELGRGGMGIVYRARQQYPPREVALKVIRPEAVSQAGLRRFERESELLARLNHAGIARIYGAGVVDTPGGRRPFFAMELVTGLPISEYICRHTPPIKERLELLARVCDAAHHAHQKGVIHRDLKPSNVLVDETGQPRIIDFGVAGEIDAQSMATMLTTEIGVLGTLVYMSPEQLSNSGGAPDTRTDVYALGVMAYEVLSGHAAFDVRGSGLAAAIHTIERQTPVALGNRDRRLRGDIETVVAKAMARDRSRRYGAASDFAADLRRCITHEAILARPPSVVYQARMFARRNKALVGGMVAVTLAVSVGVGGVAWQSKQTRRQVAMRDLAFRLSTGSPVMTKTGSREARRADLQTVSAWLMGASSLPAPLKMSLSRSVADRLITYGDSEEAAALYGNARRLLPESGVQQVFMAMRLEDSQADALRRSGDPWASVRITQEALARDSRATAPDQLDDDGSRAHGIRRAKLSLAQARSLHELGRLDEAERILREILPELERLQSVSPPDNQWDVLATKIALARVLVDLGPETAGEGLALVNEVFAIDAARAHPSQIDYTDSFALLRGIMGEAMLVLGSPVQAEELFRAALGALRRNNRSDHPSVLRCENALGRALLELGRTAEGEPLLRAAAEGMERQYPGHWRGWVYSADLGRALAELGQNDEASERLTRARDALRVFGEGDRRYVETERAIDTLSQGAGAP